jgi:sulfate/thiosulfate-binding protein
MNEIKHPSLKPGRLSRALSMGGFAAALLLLSAHGAQGAPGEVALLHASYDVTRELYKDVNAAFAAKAKADGVVVTINQSHGGSSKQARAVIDGLKADVVSMNQSLDIEAIEKAGLIKSGWAERLPNHSVPFTSTIVFVVKAGNPKHIVDWSDLVRPGVVPIIPNPKTSGNGRYSYLAAWAFAVRQAGGDEGRARAFLSKLFTAVPVMDTGGRGATATFVERGIGDVLLTFENEAWLATRDGAHGNLVTIVPPSSIVAEAPVAVVDKVVASRGTRDSAEAYLRFLFSDDGQELAAKHHLRPFKAEVLARHRAAFPKLGLQVTVDELGGWSAIQKRHFADGGLFDQIFAGGR